MSQKSPSRDQILVAIKYVLNVIVSRKMNDVPLMFRSMLGKFSPESLSAMLEGELSEADWIEIEKIFLKE